VMGFPKENNDGQFEAIMTLFSQAEALRPEVRMRSSDWTIVNGNSVKANTPR